MYNITIFPVELIYFSCIIFPVEYYNFSVLYYSFQYNSINLCIKWYEFMYKTEYKFIKKQSFKIVFNTTFITHCYLA